MASNSTSSRPEAHREVGQAAAPDKNSRRERLLDEAPTGQGSRRTTEGPGSAHDDDDLQLPHERDQSVGDDATGGMGNGAAGDRQREVLQQAHKDLSDGQVDTDMRATPGLDAQRRGGIVNDPKGEEPPRGSTAADERGRR